MYAINNAQVMDELELHYLPTKRGQFTTCYFRKNDVVLKTNASKDLSKQILYLWGQGVPHLPKLNRIATVCTRSYKWEWYEAPLYQPAKANDPYVQHLRDLYREGMTLFTHSDRAYKLPTWIIDHIEVDWLKEAVAEWVYLMWNNHPEKVHFDLKRANFSYDGDTLILRDIMVAYA